MNKTDSSLQSFCRELMDVMPQIMRGFIRYEHKYFASGNITPPQIIVMDYLRRQGPVPMKDITKLLGISKPAATALTDRLISQDFIRREKDENDRRVVRVAITSKGTRIIEGIIKQRLRTLSVVFSKISPRDRQEYLRILRAVREVIKQLHTVTEAHA